MREGGSNNIVKKGDKWRRGVKPKTDVTTSKKYLFNIRIRVTLKVVIRPLPLLFNLAFHVDNKVWVENMHILADMRSKIWIKDRLIISSPLFGWWKGGKWGQGKRWQSVTRVQGVQISVVGRWYTFWVALDSDFSRTSIRGDLGRNSKKRVQRNSIFFSTCFQV